MKPSDVAETVVSALGYPRTIHGVINVVSSTSLSVAPSAQIAPFCLLRGDIDLDPEVRLSTRCVLNGDVSVGKHTNVEPQCEFVGDVEIGRYCAIARNNTFQQTDHEMGKPSMQRRMYQTLLDSELAYTTKGEITVGSDVWFGTRCIVLSGVTIGHGAVVAAGSVVTDDVEPYAIVAGTPAERIGWRFPRDVRAALLELAWWEWNDERIREHPEFFDSHIRTVDDLPRAEPGTSRDSIPSP